MGASGGQFYCPLDVEGGANSPSFHVHFEQIKDLKFEIENIFYACKLHECNDSTLLYESDAIQD